MSNEKDPGLRTPSSFVTFRLARLQSSLNAQAVATLKAHGGPSLVEWRLIQSLRIYGQASMTELAGLVQMDKGQLSRKIAAMVEKGLLRIEKDPQDQRVQHLHLTEAAQALSRSVMPIMEARQRHLLQDLSPEELAQFYSVLDRLEAASKDREFK